MTQEQFDSLVLEDSWIHTIATAHEHCDSRGRAKFLQTCSYPVEYIVTPEMKAKAAQMAARRKAEILAGIRPGELCFASMGMNTNEADSVEGGVNNHRIRCFFLDGEGKRFLIEFSLGCKGDSYYVSEAVDCGKEEAYERRCLEVAQWNAEHRCDGLRKTYPPQDCYNPHGAKDRAFHEPFTWDNVVKAVNRIFRCSYTSGRKIDHFVTYEEFTNKCQ